MPDINANCEVTLACLQFYDCRPLYAAGYYVPHSSKQKALNEPTKLLFIIHRQISNMSNVVIGGDFNFADINWDSWSTTKPSAATDHRYFLKFLFENSLSQVVMVVARLLSNSILDLLTTTNPSLLNSIETHTGISDHLLVTFDICIETKYQTMLTKKYLTLIKADTINHKSKVLNFTQEFMNSNPIKNSVDANWEIIQHSLCTIMDTAVPCKLSHGK